MSTKEIVVKLHTEQDNKETEGNKCNRCAYDIIWDKPNAERIFGKNRPFEADNTTAHTCDKDDQDNVILRKGYGIRDGKAFSLISKSSGAGQQQLSVSSTDVQPQIQELIRMLNRMTESFEKSVAKQNQDIAELRGIVTQYTTYNPFAGMFKDLTDRMLSYLPPSELGPKRADELESLD